MRPVPGHARRRTVFVVSCPDPLPGCPLVIDPSGFWFRPEGRHFVAGTAPEPDVDDLPLEPNYAEFDEALWARMARRVPAFEALRVEPVVRQRLLRARDAIAIIGPDKPTLRGDAMLRRYYNACSNFARGEKHLLACRGVFEGVGK